ncbi:MAG: FAD-dependent oxidoreductase [Elusimicrobia bacterium]|nr:FAD-dependent oxidoreductase [Elusimicrobiota bacterium]
MSSLSPAARFDAVIIGGGITGAGVARDCAMRGMKTLLLEAGGPGCKTTAASTHLIHGGLRYLLYDRLTTHVTSWDSGHIVRVAGNLLTRLPIIWPVYSWHRHGIETVETLLEAYDRFQAMKEGRPHLRLDAAETLKAVPGLKAEGLVGSVAFDEWVTDAVGLVEANLGSARRHGAEVRCGAAATGLLVSEGRVAGVLTDSGPIGTGVVVNASGPWIARTAAWAGASIEVTLRKGSHLVYDRRLFPVGLIMQAPAAITPQGGDRYVFVIPLADRTLVGPTDLPGPADPDDTVSDPEEASWILDSVRPYFTGFPADYRRVMVGSRPILDAAGNEKLLSRGFEVFDHEARDRVAGLVTVGGGKMSDFRLMAETATDLVCRKLGVNASCRTHLETLSGQPAAAAPGFEMPSRFLQDFLKKRPRLRELHALSHLGWSLARHWAGQACLGRRLARADHLAAHFR